MESTSFGDRPVPVANHLAQLHSVIRRAALVFVIIAAITSIWIESIVFDWASTQSPAGALSVYGPYDWVEMRIVAVFIIAATLTLPFLSLDIRKFARPGLSLAEKRWFDSFLLLSAILVPLTLYWVWFEMIPYFVEIGLELDTISGVSAHYDAAELFALASGLSWILILLFISSLFLSLSRIFGLVEGGHSRFRNRILAICAGTLILTLPATFEGVRVLIAVTVACLTEILSRSTPTGPLGARIIRLPTLRDRDGDTQRVLMLDCSCEGACPSMNRQWAGRGIGVVQAGALCLEQREQEELLETARRTGLTRLAVTGCDGTPIPNYLTNALTSAGTQVIGLGWLDDPRSDSQLWRRQSVQMHTSQYRASSDESSNQ